MKIELHSKEREAKNGRKFRSYYLTTIDGQKVEKKIGVKFVQGAQEPKDPDVLIDVAEVPGNNFGNDKAGYPALFIGADYSVVKKLDPPAMESNLSDWKKWTNTADPDPEI